MLDYEENYHTVFHDKVLNSEEHYLLRSKLSLKRYFQPEDIDKKILEFGVGTGYNSFLFHNKYGFDISKFALDFVKKKGFITYNNLDDIPENFFDIVLISHVLSNVTDPYQTLLRCRNYLVPGGKLILIIPYEHNKKVELKLSPSQHLFSWNFLTINNLLFSSGFNVIKNKKIFAAGYYKTSFLANINFKLWDFSVALVGFLSNKSELLIEAIKQG
uniref:Class I SAM-dependent methyltransferase n=1 Tax=Ignavibacterium album TaxID=591197 RepID=A0A832DG86_9BACT